MRVEIDGTLLWNQNYPGIFYTMFYSVTELADGNFIAVGSYYYSTDSDNQYIWIVKLDCNGNILSQKVVGSTASQNDGIAVCSTSDNGYIVCALIVVDGINIQTELLKYNSLNVLELKKSYDISNAPVNQNNSLVFYALF